MRDHVILVSVVIVASSSIVTAFGMVWLCTKLGLFRAEFLLNNAIVGQTVVDNAVVLHRVEDASEAAKVAADEVAHSLADSIARADALPNDGNFGAAADAALRSEEDPQTKQGDT